jgi:hypothetical protein
MKKRIDEGEAINSQMKMFLKRLKTLRHQIEKNKAILISFEENKANEWYRAHRKFPPTSEVMGDDDDRIILEPDATLGRVIRFEQSLLREIHYLRSEDSSAQDERSIPKSWKEFDELKQSFEILYKKLENEVNKSRKAAVKKMKAIYAKELNLTLESNFKIKERYLFYLEGSQRKRCCIVELKYDYQKKQLMGIMKGGASIAAKDLRRY